MARELPKLTTEASHDGSVELNPSRSARPGVPVDRSVRPAAGTRPTLVITGSSGSGKTTLLRSLAELWPFASGTLRRPTATTRRCFFAVALRAARRSARRGVLPATREMIPEDTCCATLTKVALSRWRPARRRAGLGQGALPR